MHAQIYGDTDDRGCDETNKEMGNERLCLECRNGEEYKLNDNKEGTLIVHPENVPFPDIPAEAPGILTKQEEAQGVNAI